MNKWLSRSELFRAIAATIVASAAATLASYVAYNAYPSTGDAFSSGLGSSISAAMVFLIVYTPAEVFALKVFKVGNWFGIGLVFSAAALVSLFRSQGSGRSFHPWLYFSVEIVGAVILLSALWAIFNRLRAHIILRSALALAVAVLAVAGMSAFATAQDDDYIRTTEQTSENSVNFTIYLPKSLPADTKLVGIELPIANGKQVLDATDTKAFVTLHFSGTLSEGYESKVDSSYNPPANCGEFIPGFPHGATQTPCPKVVTVGTTDIYEDPNATPGSPEPRYYFKTGDTLIELGSIGRALTGDEIANIVNALEPITPARAKQLNDSLTPPAR